MSQISHLAFNLVARFTVFILHIANTYIYNVYS